jgi:hypothetical protein
MEQKREEKIPVAITGGSVVFLIVVGCLLFLWYGKPYQALPSLSASTTPPVAAPLIRTTPGVETWYTNDTLHFSFRLPDGFMAPEAKSVNVSGAQAVTVYNKDGDTLLVVAIPLASAAGALTEDEIHANTPGQTITNVEQGAVGALVTGFSFDTDDKEWGGDGVGFWFAYNGYLYEITTYAKDAPLLDFIRSTWQFSPPVPPPPK